MAELFQTIDQVKEYIAVNSSFDINTLAPYIAMAGDKYIKEWIGTEQYNELVAQELANSLTSNNEKLLPFVRRAVIHFAFYEYAPIGQIQFSGSGIHISVSENKKTAFEHQVKLLRESFIETGYDSLESTMAFLEENENDYTKWKNSSSYTKNREGFINTSKDFSDLYELKRRSQTFKAITPIMKHMEEFAIKPTIGPAYFDELKSLIRQKSDTSAHSMVIQYVKAALAFFTIAEAISQDMVSLTPDGIITNNSSGALSQDNARVSAKINQAKNMGNRYLDMLVNYLTSNINSFPSYKAYAEKEEEETESSNKKLKSIFRI